MQVSFETNYHQYHDTGLNAGKYVQHPPRSVGKTPYILGGRYSSHSDARSLFDWCRKAQEEQSKIIASGGTVLIFNLFG